MSATTDQAPTPEERERAAWKLLNAQIAAAQRAAVWEPYRNLALILLVVAATTGLVGFILESQQPKVFVVQFPQPIAIKLLP